MKLVTQLTAAAFAGFAILVLIILPAEYGIDPTGLGKKLGLTALSAETTSSPRFEAALGFNIGEYDPSAERIEMSIQGLIHREDVAFKTEIIDIDIEDFGEVEYKFIMPADTTFVYSWEVLGAGGDGVYYDFHGHPSSADASNYPERFEMAYAKGEATQQHGSFTAPFTGYHGFYFLNIEQGPIKVRLKVSGYWKEHQEMFRAVKDKVLNNVEF